MIEYYPSLVEAAIELKMYSRNLIAEYESKYKKIKKTQIIKSKLLNGQNKSIFYSNFIINKK